MVLVVEGAWEGSEGSLARHYSRKGPRCGDWSVQVVTPNL